MKIQLSFEELQRIAKEKSNQNVGLSYVDDHTCKVSASMQLMPFLGKAISVALNLKIDKVETNTVYANLSGHMAVDLLLSTGLSMVNNLLPDGLIETANGGNIILHLDRSEKLQHIFEKATLTEIHFVQDAVEILAVLKV